MRKIKSSGTFEDAVFHLSIRIPSTPPTALARSVCWCRGMLSVTVPPISALNAITTMGTMPSSARGGLVSAIKLKLRFGLITGVECDSKGNAYSLAHANGC